MITLKEDVIHDGRSYHAGENVKKIDPKQAQRLVDLGVADFAVERVPFEAETGNVKELDPGNENYTEELSTIDYNDLKQIATTFDIEFKGNISKKDLVSLIIDEGKAKEALDLTEEEE